MLVYTSGKCECIGGAHMGYSIWILSSNVLVGPTCVSVYKC
jgi:hypothetical protein